MNWKTVLTWVRKTFIVLLTIAMAMVMMLYALSIGATVPLWERRGDPFQERFTIQVTRGYAQIEHQWFEIEATTPTTWDWIVARKRTMNILNVVAPDEIPDSLNRPGLIKLGPNWGIPTRATYLDVPLWGLFLLLSIYPAVAFARGPLRRRLLLRRSRRIGLCRKCDYNLTGNESGVCPQ